MTAGLRLATLLIGVGIGCLTSSAAAQPHAGPDAARFDDHRLVRVQVQSKAQLELLGQISDDIWTHRPEPGPIDCRVSPEAMAKLQASGLAHDVIEENLQSLIDAESKRLNGPSPRAWFDDYKDYNAINEYLQTLADLRPDLAQKLQIGSSLEGRPVYALRISNDAVGSPGCKPAVVFTCCQHAREWIAPMVGMFAADALIRRYDDDPILQQIVDSSEIIIVPIVNVDGYEFTWSDNRLWRKNRRDNGNGSFGVDLNRNWSYGWGSNNGSSGNPGSGTYRGPFPFSEPEIDNVRNLIISNPRVRTHIDIHSYGQMILAPWGYTSDLPPEHETYQALGAQMRQLILDIHGKAYRHGPLYTVLYPISGGIGDWFWGNQALYSFLFELRGNPGGFILPPEQIIPNGEEILPSLIAYTQWTIDQFTPTADFNADGTVNAEDVQAFLTAFSTGDPAADMNADRQVNIRDILIFLNFFVEGC